MDSRAAKPTASAGPVRTLVLGGARSGKSEIAENIVARHGAGVTYVATCIGAGEGEKGWRARIEAHRRRRPAAWRTVEVPAGGDLSAVLVSLDGPLIIDSLGTWLAGLDGFRADVDRLCAALTERDSPAVIVSDEVGLGVHPASSAGMEFRDALGELNRRVGMVCDEVILVVAGRAMSLPASRPGEAL